MENYVSFDAYNFTNKFYKRKLKKRFINIFSKSNFYLFTLMQLMYKNMFTLFYKTKLIKQKLTFCFTDLNFFSNIWVFINNFFKSNSSMNIHSFFIKPNDIFNYFLFLYKNFIKSIIRSFFIYGKYLIKFTTLKVIFKYNNWSLFYNFYLYLFKVMCLL